MPAGPAGIRWSIGDWLQFPDDAFLSEPTKAALDPLASEVKDDDPAAADRWREIGFAALRQAQPLALLPATDQAIEFVAHPMLGAVEQALVMQQTVSASRFHEVFPAWRRLATLAEAARADEATMAELRHRVQVTMTAGGAPRAITPTS